MSKPRGAWWSPEQTNAALAARQQAADAAVAGLDPLASALSMRSGAPAELDGLDADSIRRMPMSSYGEIRRRAGLPEQDPYADMYVDFEPPGTPRTVSAPEAVFANADMGIDISSLSMSEYAQIRDQLGMGVSRKENRGLLNQSGSQSWVEAAQGQPGRSSWQGRNVVESPRLEGRHVRQDDMRDTRSAAGRFGTPGNSFQVR
jgi:hypothetical protein